MEFIKNNQYLFAGIVVGALVVYIVSSVTIERKLSQLQLSLDTSIEVADTEAVQLAQEIGRGGQMHPATTLIVDCSNDERDAFESHLANLDQGLSNADLAETDLLFSRCAPTQAVRRTIMTMDLSRRVDNLRELVIQRKQIGNFVAYDETIQRLTTLVELEEEMTEISFDLVFLQREIIDLLLSGVAKDSEQATLLKKRGVELRTELSAKAMRAQELRRELHET